MPLANVVVQTAFLGDLILSIPVLNHIKKINPEHKLILICKKGLGSFLIQDHIVDIVVEIEKGQAYSYKEALKFLNSGEYDIDNLFCLHRSIRSSLFCQKINAKSKAGYANILNKFIFNKTVYYDATQPETIRSFGILSHFDEHIRQQLSEKDHSQLNQSNINGELPVIPEVFSFSAIEKKTANKNLNDKKNIALFPGSVWPTKMWTLQGFSDLAKVLVSEGHQVFLMGSESESHLAAEILKQVPEAINCAGKYNISKSLEVLETINLVVANDSAPIHMAAYKNIPTVALFGPTTLSLGFRPWQNNARVVELQELSCRPCGKHGHKACPLGHHSCMKDITVDQVMDKIKSLLTAPL